MHLIALDGSQLEAHLVGYESPTNEPTNDRNWLLASIHISTPQGSGRTVENCWQIEEVQRMIVWFRAMADGVPVQYWGGACLEANLEFELVAISVSSVRVRATFIVESGLWHPVDGSAEVSHYHGCIDFDLAHEDLQSIALQLAEELQQDPPIAPLSPLPSPPLASPRL
jgi:hypothetical protein